MHSNNLNIFNITVNNNPQIGIWYANPNIYLKITEYSAKLNIPNENNKLISLEIGYNIIGSCGLFRSSKLKNYHRNQIEFKYDSHKNIINLYFYNKLTKRYVTIYMTKLSKI